MDFARKILRSILNEEVNQNSAIDAIKKHYEVKINYQPDNDREGSGERTIQAVCYGRSPKGNMLLHAYQPNGDTRSSVPSWKTFRMDCIENWSPDYESKFSQPPGFNPNGDNSMDQVFFIASFDGSGNSGNVKPTQQSNNVKQGQQKQTTDTGSHSKQNIVGQTNDTKGNNSSISNMQRANNFGNGTNTQTVGPVRKGNTEQPNQNGTNKDVNYDSAKMNGPVYRGSEREQLFKNSNKNSSVNLDNADQDDDINNEENNDLDNEQ